MDSCYTPLPKACLSTNFVVQSYRVIESNYPRSNIWMVLGLFAGGVVLAGLVLIVGPWLWFLYKIEMLPPLNWDVVTAKGSDCQLSDRRWVKNAGLVAVLRDANCPGYFAQGTAYYVVFVHRIGEANTKENLVFQYTPGFDGDTLSAYPKIVWTGPNELKIDAPGVIEGIWCQRDIGAGVGITYKLGKVWPDATSGIAR